MDNDAASINRMLLDRFEEVCMELLPNGKRYGNMWVVGSIAGEAGESLQITLNGSAAGRFKDFSDGDTKGASPLWLWTKAKNITFPEAIAEAKKWLGLKDDDFGVKRHRAKTYSKPDKAAIRLAESNTPVMDYLTLERRLNPIVVANANVCETEDGLAMAFPFYDLDEETGKQVCVHRKFLKLERVNGKKDSWTTKGTKRCLFGKQLISDNVSEITITEGEIDALSWLSWDIPAVSIPNGVSDFEWVDVDYDWLARFERINVCMDMDDPGKQAAIEICKRLGLHRCFIVSLPKKDPNECLVAGMDRAAMLEILAKARPVELDEIKKPADFTDEVIDYYETDPSLRGWETPWTPTLPWRVRKSELTILTGFSGHGKTAGLNQLMLHMVNQGLKVMDASLEIKPGMTLYNMTRCAMAKKHSKKPEIEACIGWLNDSMFFLDCIGTVNVKRLMHAMEYARKRHGIDVFVIDSLFKCGLGSEDYGAQKDFVDVLTTFCNNTGAHVILVAHSRKTSNGNEEKVPTKSDVSGSSDITNAAFNVIVFWRNKEKKRRLDRAREENDVETIAAWIEQPDGRIVVDKQRFGEGEEREINVWFDPESCQFHTQKYKKLPYFIFA